MTYENFRTSLTLRRADFNLSFLQTHGLIWMAIATGLGFLVGLSALLNVRPIGYGYVAIVCAGLLGLALLLNTMSFSAAARIALLCEGLFLLSLGSSMMLYLSYDLQMMALPLQDVRFAALDQSLGFNYSNFIAFLNEHDLTVRVLHRAYYSFRWQILGTVVVLALLGHVGRLNLFLSTLLLALAASCVVGTLLPAAGAISMLSFEDIAALHWKIDGATPIEHLERLREGSFISLNLSELGGIISFPSFHAATAAIVTLTWFRLTKLYIFVGALNVLMTTATLSQGGHYLVDTIAGLSLGVASFCMMSSAYKFEDVAPRY